MMVLFTKSFGRRVGRYRHNDLIIKIFHKNFSKYFYLWTLSFGIPVLVIITVFVYPHYAGQANHTYGLGIFSGFFAGWYFWKRRKDQKKIFS